ncbi:MAG: energy transducer TonB [Ignavibacteriae bacterium]|nr:energy transducer TonB [Ignavibacteriota bacterium]
MKCFIFIFFILNQLLIENTFCQIQDSCKVYEYYEVDKIPQFNFQNKKLSEYIDEKFIWPNNVGAIGEVLVSYIVDEKGKVENIKIVKSLGGICDEYSKTLFENIPDFEPGKINSKSVKVRMFLVIKFILK